MSLAPYRVVWKRSAIEVELASILLRLDERGEPVEPVWQAMDLLERALVIDPDNVGESRPDFERIATEGPLTVQFAVHDDEHLVYVLGVTYLLPRSRRG